MALRRPDECSTCNSQLPAGTRAEWDAEARAVTCLDCAASTPEPPPAVTPAPPLPTTPAEAPPPIDTGEAGASARKEHQRRQAKREARLEEKWGTGRLGRLAKALSADPQSTKAWVQGAVGEERVAKTLADRLGDTAVLLHDRKVPRTRGNIDHLVGDHRKPGFRINENWVLGVGCSSGW